MIFIGRETLVDLLVLDMIEFDVILGMDWLSSYHTVLDCFAKIVTLALSGVPRIAWKGTLHSGPKRVISYIQTRKLVERGCLSYLAHIHDTSVILSPSLDSVCVIRELWMCSLRTYLVYLLIEILISVLMLSQSPSPFPFLLIG